MIYPKDLSFYEIRRSGDIDQNASYTNGYPSALWLYGSFFEAQKYGQIGICIGKVDFKKDGCSKGGISILYGIPEINGKGGMCNRDYQKTKIAGQEVDICYGENSFLISYPKHPQGISELNIFTTYGEGLSKERATAIVYSIKFIEK